MTPEEQRIAIGAACGLDTKRCPIHHSHYCCAREIPKYTEDLNACFEMEKHIIRGGSNYTHYVSELVRLTAHNDSLHSNHAWHATAAQRCEAFLRCLNLWKGE